MKESATMAEVQLLSAVITTGGGNEYYPEAGDTSGAFALVRSGDAFGNPLYGSIWDAIQTIHDRGEPINPLSVLNMLHSAEHGFEFDQQAWSDVLEQIGSPWDESAQFWRSYAQRVQSAHFARSAHSGLAKLSSEAVGGTLTLGDIESAVATFRDMTPAIIEDTSDAPGLMLDLIEAQQENFDKPGLKGARTGFDKLDTRLGGWQPGKMVIVAARPSVGKTALAVNAFGGMLSRGHVCEFISLEMGKTEIATRLVCGEARCSYPEAAYHRTPSKGAHTRITRAVETVNGWKLRLHDPPSMTVRDLSRKCREAAERGAECVFVDYVGLLRPDTKSQRESRFTLITEASIAVKEAARANEICIILLAQLGRAADKAGTSRPKLSDLRESGQLEQDADTVVFLHRPDMGEGEEVEDAELYVAKNRNGATGIIQAQFFAEQMRFEEER